MANIEFMLERQTVRSPEFNDTGIRLGVTWSNLSIQQTYADACIRENVLTQLNPWNMIKHVRMPTPVATIIDRSQGCVKPGEMLLVLGQPAECSALLSSLAGRRKGYKSVTGEIWYGSMKQKNVKNMSRVATIANCDVSFPTDLTVMQLLDYVLDSKEPRWKASNNISARAWRVKMRDYLIDVFNLGPPVGKEFVTIEHLPQYQRQLLSLAESIAAQPSIICWDDYTRGLDAGRAFRCTKIIRELTDALGLATITSLDQASDAVYKMYDKILVLDQGKQVFYGSAQDARLYVQSMAAAQAKAINAIAALTNLLCSSTQTTHACLSGRNASEYDAFQLSQLIDCHHWSEEMDYPSRLEVQQNTNIFAQAMKSESSFWGFVNGLLAQLRARSIHRRQSLRGHLRAAAVKQFSTLIQALTCGTLMINAPQDSSGFSVKTGALFFSVLFHSLMALSEIPDFFSNRAKILKYRSLGFYHGTGVVLEQTLYDVFSIFIQVTVFSLPFYFLVGLTRSAPAFFTYWMVLFSKSMTLVALFRFVAVISSSMNTATLVSGVLSNAMISYCGYVVSHPNMEVWFAWLFWINPDAWAYEALADNEFNHKIIACVGANLIPHGAEYPDSNHQSCGGVSGAAHGQTYLTGNQYLQSQGYDVSRVWRNVGLMWAVWLLFSIATTIALHSSRTLSNTKRSTVESRQLLALEKSSSYDVEAHGEQEKLSIPDRYATPICAVDKARRTAMKKCEDLVAIKNLTYSAPAGASSEGSFQNVTAWIKPGTLTAVLGSARSNKSALLDAVAQRLPQAYLEGSILVNGNTASTEFRRCIGYPQNRLEMEPGTTVKDALLLSALLRRGSNIPRSEKVDYIETIIEHLGLENVVQSCIGSPKVALSLEDQKRVSLAIELVAHPSVLILNDFTLNLNRQSSIRIHGLLRALANAGQTIIITVSEPYLELFTLLDAALLLDQEGQTIYFGDVGPDAKVIDAYFARYGGSLSAIFDFEFEVDKIVTKTPSQDQMWHAMWQRSKERHDLDDKLEQLLAKPKSCTHESKFGESRLPSSSWTLTKIAVKHMSRARFRNTSYVNNAFALHVLLGLFNGFSYFQLGHSVTDQGLRQSTIFNFIFVAPGVVAQIQPHFFDTWNLYTSEGGLFHLEPYGGIAIAIGLVVTEIPYIVVNTLLYFVSWYYTVGLPIESNRTGAIFFTMFAYGLVYSSMGQLIAACSPTMTYASFFNPLILGNFVAFAGILVPYSLIPSFWRSWAYWANPFTYMVGSIFIASSWEFEITCTDKELAVFDPPVGLTCNEYLQAYQESPDGMSSRLINPHALEQCQVCVFRSGEDWCHTRNYHNYNDGWRDAGITMLFACGYYVFVLVVCALRFYITKRKRP